MVTLPLTLGAAHPAFANFQVCNQTLDVVNVAIAHHEEDWQNQSGDWKSEGWWTVGPNQCANVIEDTLRDRYIYLFVRDVFNKAMLNGDRTFCIRPGQFEITGNENCLLNGHIAAQFQEVDTRQSERWTFFLHGAAD